MHCGIYISCPVCCTHVAVFTFRTLRDKCYSVHISCPVLFCTHYIVHISCPLLFCMHYIVHISCPVLFYVSYVVHISCYVLLFTHYSVHISCYVLLFTHYSVRISCPVLFYMRHVVHISCTVLLYTRFSFYFARAGTLRQVKELLGRPGARARARVCVCVWICSTYGSRTSGVACVYWTLHLSLFNSPPPPILPLSDMLAIQLLI